MCLVQLGNRKIPKKKHIMVLTQLGTLSRPVKMNRIY